MISGYFFSPLAYMIKICGSNFHLTLSDKTFFSALIPLDATPLSSWGFYDLSVLDLQTP